MKHDIKDYYNSLSDEQKTAYNTALDKAEENGLDIEIIDAVDIWYMIPKHLRGERPE